LKCPNRRKSEEAWSGLWADARGLSNSVAEWCRWWGLPYEGLHFHVTEQHLWQPSSPVCATSRPHFIS
jgi:hypothetical protein